MKQKIRKIQISSMTTDSSAKCHLFFKRHHHHHLRHHHHHYHWLVLHYNPKWRRFLFFLFASNSCQILNILWAFKDQHAYRESLLEIHTETIYQPNQMYNAEQKRLKKKELTKKKTKVKHQKCLSFYLCCSYFRVFAS